MFRQPVFRCFNCIATEYKKNYLQLGEPGTIVDDSEASEDESSFSFFGRSYTPTVWCYDSDIASVCTLVSNNMEMLVRDAIGSSPEKKDYLLVRKYLCEFFLASRALYTSPAQELNHIKSNVKKYVRELLGKIPKLKDFPNYILLSSWEHPNIKRTSAYNSLHFTLDIYWLTITLIDQLEDDELSKFEVFDRNISYIIEHLIACSLQKFSKISNYTNLYNTKMYLCPCYKELWLLIQLYLEEVSNNTHHKEFWYYFNKSLMKEMDLLSGKDAVACLWVLVNVAQLQGLDSNGSFIGPHHHRVVSNYSMIQQCFTHITNAGEMHDQLLCCSLQFFGLLQETWWKSDANFDIINLLWEFYNKRLNKSVINKQGNMPVNFYDYSVLAENILQYKYELSPGQLCSFDIFVKLLHDYFVRFPTHWPKLKGRIYSKLSGLKMADLTDVGLHNLVKMFCVLARTINFNEVSNKIQHLLSLIRATGPGRSSVIWSTYISLIVMKSNLGMPPTGDGHNELSSCLMLLVEPASWDRSQDGVMRIFLEGLNKIISSDSSLQCYHLFGGWIHRYLQWCPHKDACYLIMLLRSLLLRIEQNERISPEWWTVMEINVVPYILQASNDSDTPPEVAELAALLISVDGTRFRHLLEHMAGNSVNVNFCCKFLRYFFEQDRRVDLNLSQETLLKQAWVRIAVLTTDKSVLSGITNRMKCLPSWFPMDSDSQSPDETDDPLYSVIRSAGLRLRDSKSVEDTNALKNWFEVYFGKMDLWVTVKKHTTTISVLRIYTTAAILYLHCAPALYTKLKNTCIFYRLTAVLLLSESLNPNDCVIMALRNTWHLFVRGIGRLDFKTDMYLESVLKDMAIRYVPYMYECNSPIIRCLDAEFENLTTEFILDKISSILISCKSRHSHEHCLPALKLILEMSRKECDDGKSEILMRTVMPSLFEQLMFSEHVTAKNVVIRTISSFHNNKNTTQVKSIFKTSIMNIVHKHLAFNSGSVFRLLELLANISRSDVENIMSYLNEAVTRVEHMRGVQFDNSLRSGLHRIEELLQKQ